MTFDIYPISRDRVLTRQAIAALEKVPGVRIVHNWADGEKRTYDERDKVIAEADVHATRHCHAVFMMWTEGMKGAWWEAGMAYAWGKNIIVVGCPDKNDCIFFRLNGIEFFDSLDEAVKRVEVYAAHPGCYLPDEP